MGIGKLFRRKEREFVPIQEVKEKEEEQRVVGIFQRKQARGKAARKKAFQKKVSRFREGAEKFRGVAARLGSRIDKGNLRLATPRLGSRSDTGGLGISMPSLFGEDERVSIEPRRKNKKRVRRQKGKADDNPFGDIGTDRFF